MNILGISAYYHDSAAALVRDGKIIAAAQEERFTRKKHDAAFPLEAIKYCLKEGGISGEIDAVAFYEKPIVKFDRLLETYFSIAPHGMRSFVHAMPIWLRQKLWIPLEIEKKIESLGVRIKEDMYFPEHHEAHGSSAFFPSPFQSAAILTLDGVGEWATSTISHGKGNKIDILQELRFPHSLGLLYSAFTFFTGFRVNSGEYKLMGLAPYGEPTYVDIIRRELLDLREDGSFRLNLDYFDYLGGDKMTNDRFAKLFGGPARTSESQITRREMDLARSIQVVTEDIVLRMARHAHKVTGESNVCLAGGVALNCVANGRLLREGPFKNVWIQPAAGDAGGALGAAMYVWHQVKDQPRHSDGIHDHMQNGLLGPSFDDDVAAFLAKHNYPAEHHPDRAAWADRIAGLIADEKVVALCQGRMEFGPRALGGRSIIGDARSPKMQSVMNLKIKFRESFRPFAPMCLAERVSDYFEMTGISPYMLLVAPVQKARRKETTRPAGTNLLEHVNQSRSDIPAITHIDYSARIQTVDRENNPALYDIIQAFDRKTGYAVIINTSFNVRGEPIVCTPEDAYRCFMRTEMDCLVLGSHILFKANQPEWKEDVDWRTSYALD